MKKILSESEKRTIFIGFYISEEEREKLMEDAKAVGMNNSNYIRWTLFYKNGGNNNG